MTGQSDNRYPDAYMDHHRMNRVLRHRLRNLCAGVKMTVERVAATTAATHPQVGGRCDIIIKEMDNLREFTDRMDWLFDALPEPGEMSMFEMISALRKNFVRRFPLAGLRLDGPECDIGFRHGNWLLKAMEELLDNAGDSCEDGQTVNLEWTGGDGGCGFIITHPGTFPEEIPIDPPVPFFTTRSRHDGLGLSIACRLLRSVGAEWRLRQEDSGIVINIKLTDTEIIRK